MTNVLWVSKSNVTGSRAEADFYATPAECVVALLPHIADFSRNILEPACGDGAISNALLAAGYVVFSSDIVDRGYPFAGTRDFLKEDGFSSRFSVVTNPPYKHAEAFVRKAFYLGCTHIAMLLKSNFWHARRARLFEQHTPSQILPLTWRPDFTGQGRPFLDVSWNVWRPGDHAARVTRLDRQKK